MSFSVSRETAERWVARLGVITDELSAVIEEMRPDAPFFAGILTTALGACENLRFSLADSLESEKRLVSTGFGQRPGSG